MADEERGQGGSHDGGGRHHLPAPTLWPAGFAAGIALLLVGLAISWPVVAVGAGLAVVFGFLWVRDLTSELGSPAEETPASAVPEAEARADEAEERERYPRNVFLERATLGLGAVIGGVVTVPVIGFAVAPAFIGQGGDDVDLGPLDNFPENQFVIAKFVSKRSEGDVSKRAAFVRNNGLLNGVPSFTIISNRCVHLGCPTQPSGPPGDALTVETDSGGIELTPVQPANFSCPCHGGAYDIEGNRVAGPPVRALDRYNFRIENGRLVLTDPYSVGFVDGEGAEARIRAYTRFPPGDHLDGPDAWLYPLTS